MILNRKRELTWLERIYLWEIVRGDGLRRHAVRGIL